MSQIWDLPDTPRVADLRRRVRDAMDQPIISWACPERIDQQCMHEPLAVRKSRAIAAKLSAMPAELWAGQLFAGSMTLENPRVHLEWGFPDYATDQERQAAQQRGLSIRSVFGHIVPDYPTLLAKGLSGIKADAQAQRPLADGPEETAFLDSLIVAADAVIHFAAKLARHCTDEAAAQANPARAAELLQMAANLAQAPAGPAQTFWQALQAVWLLHMVFHCTMEGNAVGRLDQYAWPLLEADLAAGRLNAAQAAELVDCFCLKFNERAKTTDEQRSAARTDDPPATAAAAWQGRRSRTRHHTSSQVGADRDRLDATNHWLQNIVIGGYGPDGRDGTNPLSYLLLRSYRHNQMTNPLLTVRLHGHSPDELVRRTCETLKDGGGMPAVFNDETIIPSLERLGIPAADARDYTNDGCWEIIIPGRTDFRFQRLSLMLPLEWALRRGRSWLDDQLAASAAGSAGATPATPVGKDTGDPRTFATFHRLWQAYLAQLDAMVAGVVEQVVSTINDRGTIAPTPLLSLLIDGAIANRRDLTAGGAKYRTFALLAESAAHAIDSLTAIKGVIFEQRLASLAELIDALEADFVGHEPLLAALKAAPKYGNDDDRADQVGQDLIENFCVIVRRHAEAHRKLIRFPCGVGTFSWYIGIGEGLGASPDGRRSGEPVSSNFSPALGADVNGIPAAILSYARMHRCNLPAGSPLDLRLARRLVEGEAGTRRMAGLIRGFLQTGGAMLTLTVADTEELRAAQREPERYRSLRVRMGGWCAYFTMLSRQQQDHHIRRQEPRS